MKKSRVVLALVAGLILLGCNTVSAGNRAGAVTVTPGVGYDFFSDQRHLQNTVVLPEVSLGFNFDKNWGIEGGWGTFGTSYRQGYYGNGSAKGNIYLVDGLYHFTDYNSMFEPYVAAGLGVLYLHPNRSNADNQANLNAALGTQVFFSDSIALRGEVRDLYTMSGGKNDVLLNFGVSFLFGGDTPQAVAPIYKGMADQTTVTPT
jgi:OOP family OmpA-OmpF porin